VLRAVVVAELPGHAAACLLGAGAAGPNWGAWPRSVEVTPLNAGDLRAGPQPR
jgi:hypothetical protein